MKKRDKKQQIKQGKRELKLLKRRKKASPQEEVEQKILLETNQQKIMKRMMHNKVA